MIIKPKIRGFICVTAHPDGNGAAATKCPGLVWLNCSVTAGAVPSGRTAVANRLAPASGAWSAPARSTTGTAPSAPTCSCQPSAFCVATAANT